jgi:DNA-binding NarL/FixJ family response regulator
MVSRAVKLFPHIKKRLEDLGFPDVDITGEEKDSLNFVINEKKPKLLLIASSFYQAATPYMMGEMLNRYPKLNIAAVSVHDYPDALATWFIWHGVKSYLNLWEGLEEFYQGLEEVRRGKAYVSPRVRFLLDRFPEWPDTGNKATKRQMEALVLLCSGYVPEHIGELMHVTKKTISNQLTRMYEVFHVKNREEMVSLAWQLELITDKDIRFIDKKRKEETMPEWAVVKQKLNRGIREYDYQNEERGIPGGQFNGVI